MGAENKAIECEICKEWFHAGCVDLTDYEYEVLSTHKIGTIHWYCATCNVRSVELLCLVFGLQDRLQKSEHEIESLKGKHIPNFHSWIRSMRQCVRI